jgi:3-methyladenine DNA glycosylase AlkD
LGKGLGNLMKKMAALAQKRLRELADPAKAGPMQAYLKTSMPFYGVQSAPRKKIVSELKRRFAINSNEEYQQAVRALWELPHREEKYLALGLARSHARFINYENLAFYAQLIREGAWWDLVDGTAHLVGVALAKNPELVFKEMDLWIEDPDIWIRRVALICQLQMKERTDERRLFGYCLLRCHETGFFIRKAIGWALRQYSYTAPERVKGFILQHREKLSGLSFREAAKGLNRKGLL